MKTLKFCYPLTRITLVCGPIVADLAPRGPGSARTSTTAEPSLLGSVPGPRPVPGRARRNLRSKRLSGTSTTRARLARNRDLPP